MKNLQHIFLCFIFISGIQKFCFTQDYADKTYYLIDSLNITKVGETDRKIIESGLKQYHDAKNDTDKIKAISTIIEDTWDDNIWPVYNKWLHKYLQKKLKEKNTKEVYFFYQKSIGGIYNNMGYHAMNKGDMKSAMKYYHKSLKIAEETNNNREEAIVLSNIALIYSSQKDYKMALEYNNNSLNMYKSTKDSSGMATTLSNIGFVNIAMSDTAEGIENYLKSIEINKKLKNINGLAYNYNNIGGIYHKMNNIKLSLKYYKKGLAYGEKLGSKNLISITLNNIGDSYWKLEKIDSAFEYGSRSLKLAKELGYPDLITSPALLLANIYRKRNKGIQALDMYKLFTEMKDSINNIETKKIAAKQQAKYEYEKQKALDDAENEKKVLLEKEAKEKQKIIAYSTAGGLILVLAFLGFVFNRLRITKKQKKIIEEQRDVVKEAHKEITDSINYAERIQRSFLATSDLLDAHLNDYFVFFQPKDVVSGDFYWAGKLANNNFAIVNADSTGHGVPGAIMSILNISSIEKAVEKGITKPAEIFNDTRKTIIERLKKDGSKEGGKDGMDASIISFNIDKTIMGYTAAQNPIWIARNKELIEIKAEKMPVGKHDKDITPFTGGEFKIQKGDVIYTLTDGFQDQFGGPKGKKFMVKKMREYILSISHLPMKDQHQKISEKFTNWKGDFEQVDDACVIGVKV